MDSISDIKSIDVESILLKALEAEVSKSIDAEILKKIFNIDRLEKIDRILNKIKQRNI